MEGSRSKQSPLRWIVVECWVFIIVYSPDWKKELLQALVCSVISLAHALAFPVIFHMAFSGKGNSFNSMETRLRPAFLTSDASDRNGFTSSSRVRKYSGMVISSISFCGVKRNGTSEEYIWPYFENTPSPFTLGNSLAVFLAFVLQILWC